MLVSDTLDFLRALKHLGTLSAAKLFAPGPGTRDILIRPRGHDHSLRLRRGLVDRRVFLDVFAGRVYRTEFIPSDARLIVDAGAHAGFAACYFAQHAPRARIVALEPDQSNYSRLVLNTRSHDNVTPIQAALWREDGSLYVRNTDRSWNIQVSPDPPGTPVRAVSVPTLLRDTGMETIDVLKMNVEGAERDIFSGPVDWLANVRVLMIQLHDQYWPGCALPVYAAAAKIGFEKFQVGAIDVLRFHRK